MDLNLRFVAPAFSHTGCDRCRANVAERVASLCLFLVFSILFKAVPNAPVVARHALLGGLLTAAVFKLAFELFAWLSGYLVYDAIYGVLAALPVFLLWL